jgi:hypothetical protein
VNVRLPGDWKPDPIISKEEQEARDELARHMNAGLRLIVATQNSWKPGDTIPGTLAAVIRGGRIQTVYVTHPFSIRTEATFEEWLANTPPWIPGRKPTKNEARGYRFFELLTD